MHKNFKKSLENERKIERCSFVTIQDQERKTSEKLSTSASGAQKFFLNAERECKQIYLALSANVSSFILIFIGIH